MKTGLIALVLTAGFGCAATAADRNPTSGDYVHDAISVATPNRHAPSAATSACVVWENAEGLGVGPAQLGGLHGLSMIINPKPQAGDSSIVTSFATGLAGLKAANPQAPAWMYAVLERNRSAIEKGCEEDHRDPQIIRKLTAGDKAK